MFFQQTWKMWMAANMWLGSASDEAVICISNSASRIQTIKDPFLE